MTVFLIGLVIPLFIYVGPLRLSVYRVVLLGMFFPMLYLLFSGKVGRIRLPDICVILICIWSSLSLIIVNGLAPMIETIGILWVETLGAYLVGRCFIRTPEAFLAVVKVLFFIGLLMLRAVARPARRGGRRCAGLAAGGIGLLSGQVIGFNSGPFRKG